MTGLTFVVAAWALWFATGWDLRLLCGLAVLVFSGCAMAFIIGRSARPMLISGLVVGALAASPVEISGRTHPGAPRLARVKVVGCFPPPEISERAERGEIVMIHFFDARGFQPRWVVVW